MKLSRRINSIKFSYASSHVRRLNGEYTDVSRTISVLIIREQRRWLHVSQAWSTITSVLLNKKHNQKRAGTWLQLQTLLCLATSYEPKIRAGISWCEWTSETVSSLIIRTEMVLETLTYSPFNHLTWLPTWGYFIDFWKFVSKNSIMHKFQHNSHSYCNIHSELVTNLWLSLCNHKKCGSLQGN
jgi:hypothetical protein